MRMGGVTGIPTLASPAPRRNAGVVTALLVDIRRRLALDGTIQDGCGLAVRHAQANDLTSVRARGHLGHQRRVAGAVGDVGDASAAEMPEDATGRSSLPGCGVRCIDG